MLRQKLGIDDDAKAFLAESMKKLRLSGRGFSRVLRVARTIADLEGAETVSSVHVAESLSYRESEAFGASGWNDR